MSYELVINTTFSKKLGQKNSEVYNTTSVKYQKIVRVKNTPTDQTINIYYKISNVIVIFF